MQQSTFPPCPQTSRDQLDEKLNLRKKQLHVLFTALHQLQSSLETDEAPVVDLTTEDTTAASTGGEGGKALVDLTEDQLLQQTQPLEAMECAT